MILSGYWSGALLERMDKHMLFLFTAAFPLLLCLLSFCVRERPREPEQVWPSSCSFCWDLTCALVRRRL